MPAPHAVKNGQTASYTVRDTPRNNVGNVGNTHTAPGCQKSPETIGVAGREYHALIGGAAASNLVLVTHPVGDISNSGTPAELAALYRCRINGSARTITLSAVATNVVTLTIDGAALSAGDEIDLGFSNDGKLTYVAGGRVPDFRDLQVAV